MKYVVLALLTLAVFFYSRHSSNKRTVEAAENLASGQAFLAQNRTAEEVIETDSGLQYQILEHGKETEHPMTEAHYIQFIELLIDDNRLYRVYLKPGDKPLACFTVAKGEKVAAREYCNIHGLWKDR